ncbi:MAG: acyl-CoA desaturase [Flavobacteriales bacterium]
MPKVTFLNRRGGFQETLKARIDAYFAEHQVKPTGNTALHVKTAVLLPSAMALYIVLLAVTMPGWLSIVLAGLLGLTLALIGFNVMHDACHGSYSSKPWLNELMGLTANCLGGNAFMWKMKHNVVHHTFTNVDGMDDDIQLQPLLRQSNNQKRYWIHRLQHIYSFLLYSGTSLLMVTAADYRKYFTRRIQSVPLPRMSTKEHVIFWSSKALYMFFYCALPIMVLGWLPWLVGFFVMHACMGMAFAIVFQVAHVVEDTHFEVARTDKKIEQEWATHQVLTTANFAMRSKLISWLAGGLNFQIEHHLFPRISHVHYPQLAPIVQQVCLEHGIRYMHYRTMGGAIASHYRFLRNLGRKN